MADTGRKRKAVQQHLPKKKATPKTKAKKKASRRPDLRRRVAKDTDTNREKMLHRALARASLVCLSPQALRAMTGVSHPTMTQVVRAVSSLSQSNIIFLGAQLATASRSRLRENQEAVLERAAQEHIALQLVWLCLGGGRSDEPPNPLPEKLPVTMHDSIYKATAELVGSVAARSQPVSNFGGMGHGDQYIQEHELADKCASLEKDNERMADRIRGLVQAKETAIKDFALEVIEKLRKGAE